MKSKQFDKIVNRRAGAPIDKIKKKKKKERKVHLELIIEEERSKWKLGEVLHQEFGHYSPNEQMIISSNER